MSEKPKTPEEIFNDDDSDEDQFIDAIEREGNEERPADFDVEKEKIEGVDSGEPHGERGAHAMGEANNSDDDSLIGPEHEVRIDNCSVFLYISHELSYVLIGNA